MIQEKLVFLFSRTPPTRVSYIIYQKKKDGKRHEFFVRLAFLSEAFSNGLLGMRSLDGVTVGTPPLT